MPLTCVLISLFDSIISEVCKLNKRIYNSCCNTFNGATKSGLIAD